MSSTPTPKEQLLMVHPSFVHYEHFVDHNNQESKQNTINMNVIAKETPDNNSHNKQTSEQKCHEHKDISNQKYTIDDHCNTPECHRLNRLCEVIYQYNQYNNGDKDIYYDMYQSINIPSILNDFLHLIDEHNDKRRQFEHFKNTIGYCNASSCQIFQRHYRRNTNEKKRSTMHMENYDMYHQILDKIHFYYMHSYSNSENKSCLSTITQIKKRSMRYKQLCAPSTKTQTEKNNVKMYSFGYKFNYNDDEFGGIAVKAKYLSFKQELTMNEICTLNIHQFEDEYKKAEQYFNSDYRRKHYKNIRIEYLLSLMIYCNFTELSYHFSKTYREFYGKYHNNFYHLAKYLKTAIHKYGDSMAQKNSIKSFYHGISERVVFSEHSGNGYGLYGVQIFCPLSTSSSLEVSVNFASSGLIVEFGGDEFRCNSTKYFDVSWLSDYGNESECLFIQNQYRIHINNIIDTDIGCEYKPILKAITIFKEIIAGYDIPENISHSTLIYKLICNELSDKFPNEYKSFSSLKPYAKTLFHTFCQNRKWISIDYAKLKKYPMLFNLFCSEPYQWIKMRTVNELFPNLEEIDICNTQVSTKICSDIIQYLHDASQISTIQILNAGMGMGDTDCIEFRNFVLSLPQVGIAVQLTLHKYKSKLMISLKKIN